MRKVFFSLVATLAFGSFAMANNVELLPVEGVESLEVEYISRNILVVLEDEEALINCFDYANSAAIILGGMHNLSYYDEYRTFLLLYDMCMLTERNNQ